MHLAGAGYVVDADVWIRAYQRTYPIDVFPGVWTHLERAVVVGTLRSPRQVVEELGSKDSGVRVLVRGYKDLSLRENAECAKRVGTIAAKYPTLLHGVTHDAGDPWVIAHAWSRGHVVVTEETLSANPLKPKIPNVCRDLKIEFINTIELLRRLGLRL